MINFLNVSLSEHINERAICNAVALEKDVDGFHIVNIGKLCLDQRCMVPATAAAVWEIIRRTGQLSNNGDLNFLEDVNSHFLSPLILHPYQICYWAVYDYIS